VFKHQQRRLVSRSSAREILERHGRQKTDLWDFLLDEFQVSPDQWNELVEWLIEQHFGSEECIEITVEDSAAGVRRCPPNRRSFQSIGHFHRVRSQ
jgi:hypothetical protein